MREYAQANPHYRFPATDSEVYVEWARSLRTGESAGADAFYRAPLYPYLISAVVPAEGTRFLPLYALQIAAGLGVLLFVYLGARRLFGERAGLFGAAMGALYGPLTFYETKILPAVIGVLLGAAFVWLFVRAEQAQPRGRAGPWFAAALALGLAILCRPHYVLVLPIALVALAYRSRAAWRDAWRPLSILVLVPGAMLGLVTARNHAVSGELVFLSSNAGITFAQGNSALARGSLAPLPGISGAAGVQQYEELQVASRAAGRPISRAEANRYWAGEGLRFLREQPFDYLVLLAAKARLIVSSTELGGCYLFALDEELTPVLRLAVLPFGWIFAWCIIGLLALARRGRAGLGPVVTLAGTALTMLVFYVSARYRILMVAPALVLAGGGLDLFVRARRAPRRLACIGALAAGLFLLSTRAPVPLGAEELRRGDAAYWGNLAECYARAGQRAASAGAYDRARALDPSEPRYVLQLGITFNELHEDRRAWECFGDGVAAHPDDPELQLHYAAACWNLGLRDPALEWLARYRARVPADPRAQRLLDHIEQAASGAR